MRNFTTSIPGKVMAYAVTCAMLLPSLSQASLARSVSVAQFQAKPAWAILDFASRDPRGEKYGESAAQALTTEFTNAQPNMKLDDQFQIVAADTVRRAVDTLGLAKPVRGSLNFIRLAQEVRADYVVSGDILKFRIVSKGNSKRADVLYRVVLFDAKSGLPVNGSSLQASSPDHTGDISNDTLVNEALQAAASRAVRDILGRNLPTAAVLNTTGYDALVNAGTRSGFQSGMEVVVTRGREQVGTGIVGDVQYDQCTVTLKRSTTGSKGIAPGDKVRVTFNPPDDLPDFINTNSGIEPYVVPPHKNGNNSGLVSLLLVLGFIALVAGGGKTGNNELVRNATAESAILTGKEVDPAGTPGVRLTAVPDNNLNQVEFQWFRSTLQASAVAASEGSADHTTFDTAGAGNLITVHNPGTLTDKWTGVCNGDPGSATITVPTPLVLGQPVQYQVRLFYTVHLQDLRPLQTGESDAICFFLSQAATSGVATPLDKVGILSPKTEPTTITSPVTISFASVANSAFPINIQYVYQLSSSINFDAGVTVTSASITKNGVGQFAFPQVDLSTTSSQIPAFLRQAQTIFWRLGARNQADNPGPVKDASGQRYVWTTVHTFIRSGNPTP